MHEGKGQRTVKHALDEDMVQGLNGLSVYVRAGLVHYWLKPTRDS